MDLNHLVNTFSKKDPESDTSAPAESPSMDKRAVAAQQPTTDGPLESSRRVKRTRQGRATPADLVADIVVPGMAEHTDVEPRPRKYRDGYRTDYTDAVSLLVGDRQPGETARNMVACNDYLRLGPNRSTTKLIKIYADQEDPPTMSRMSLMSWSSKFGWFARAEQYDVNMELRRNEVAGQAMESGLALPHRRVMALKELAQKLWEDLANPNNVWLKDFRLLGRGNIVEIRRFNAAIIEQFRGVLSDLADETGGRQKTLRNLNLDLDSLTNEQLELLAAGKPIVQAIAASDNHEVIAQKPPLSDEEIEASLEKERKKLYALRRRGEENADESSEDADD